MIRGFSNNGSLIIGIPRSSLMKLLAGAELCSPVIQAGDPGPAVYLYGGETDEAIIERLKREYPAAPLPPIDDYRAKP